MLNRLRVQELNDQKRTFMKQIEAIQQQDAIILNQRKRIEEYCNQIQDVYSDMKLFQDR